jgi:hypothetical protein
MSGWPCRSLAAMTSKAGPPADIPHSARLLLEAAEIIDGWPRVRDRLRAAHVPDRANRCRACHSPNRVAPQWPCPLALVSGAVPL